MFDWVLHTLLTINPLSVNPIKWSNTIVELALRGLCYPRNQLFQLLGQKQFFSLLLGTLKYFMKIFTYGFLVDSGYSEMNESNGTIWFNANVTPCEQRS